MPDNRKSAKNYDPRQGPAKGKAKAGSRSPGHRGYRPNDGEQKKRRWSADERAARTDRPPASDRVPRGEGSSSGERAHRAPHDNRASRFDRPTSDRRKSRADGDRTLRQRGSKSDHPVRDSRPNRRSHRDEVTERPVDRDRNREERNRSREGRNVSPVRDDRARFVSGDDVVLERLDAEATSLADVEGVSFADLGLGGNIVRTLSELGAATPFPIQAATIPDVLSGRDVLGRGRTGSGKTIAFAAPVVERLMENNGGKGRKPGRKPRALILAPTRELALQIDRTVQPIARSVGLFTTQIYGGVPQHRQVMALQRGVDIVIGTPGRIEDLIEQGRLDLSEVTTTVLDEADHMCDLGFLEPVQRILRETSDGGQKLLFSATLDAGVSALVSEFLVDPAVHEVAGEDQASSTITHRILLIEQRDKIAVIEELVDRNGKTLVFARTRAFAEQLADQLDDAGIPATSLHGDLNQSRRTRNLAMLTSGRVNVLVATDVAARGIHVDDISLVIQADAPDEYKTYMHRSGRTGRAGKQGTVVTLVPRSRRRRMEGLLDRAEIRADVVPVAPGDDVLRTLSVA